MIDNSVMYGLRNPFFSDDIGMTMVNQMFPMPPGIGLNTLPGSVPMPASGMLSNQLGADTLQLSNTGKPKKDKGIWSKIALGAAAVVGVVAGYKYGGKILDFVKKFIPKK